MTSVLKDQKFGTVFDRFDRGRDGHLTADDFQATARMSARVAREDDHATAIHNAFDKWWQLLLEHGDTGGDGRISREGSPPSCRPTSPRPSTSRTRSWPSPTR